jgi:hypothetical protein
MKKVGTSLLSIGGLILLIGVIWWYWTGTGTGANESEGSNERVIDRVLDVRVGELKTSADCVIGMLASRLLQDKFVTVVKETNLGSMGSIDVVKVSDEEVYRLRYLVEGGMVDRKDVIDGIKKFSSENSVSTIAEMSDEDYTSEKKLIISTLFVDNKTFNENDEMNDISKERVIELLKKVKEHDKYVVIEKLVVQMK